MESRLVNIIIGSAGGTAGAGSKTYKLSLPSAWINELGINEDDRQVKLSFDGQKIVISRKCSMDEFKEQALAENHLLYSVEYYDENNLCSMIYADFTDEELQVENYTDALIKTAFGRNETPVWSDFTEFLEDRCVPRQRAGLNEYLDALGLDEYDPFEIVKRTSGRMAEDKQWIRVEALK